MSNNCSSTPKGFNISLGNSGSITYNGDATCLGIPPEIGLNDLIGLLANKICELQGGLVSATIDSSKVEIGGVDIDCIGDLGTPTNAEELFISIISLLCALDDAVDSLCAEDICIDVDMSCLGLGGYTDTKSVIEALIGVLCEIKPITNVTIPLRPYIRQATLTLTDISSGNQSKLRIGSTALWANQRNYSFAQTDFELPNSSDNILYVDRTTDDLEIESVLIGQPIPSVNGDIIATIRTGVAECTDIVRVIAFTPLENIPIGEEVIEFKNINIAETFDSGIDEVMAGRLGIVPSADGSIVRDGSGKIKLSGDIQNYPPNSYYGTGSGGIKGVYPLPQPTLSKMYISCTYNEFMLLKNNSELVPNTEYCITDYQAIYDQPDFEDIGGNIVPKMTIATKTAAVEKLVVLATSSNTIAPQAWSIDYPKDYIEYDPDLATTYVNEAATKGKITFRRDENGNEANCDLKGVLLKRYDRNGDGNFVWLFDSGSDDFDDGVAIFGNMCFNNTCSNNSENLYLIIEAPFDVDNNQLGDSCVSNQFGLGCQNNQLGDGCFNNQFGFGCQNNQLGDGCFNNQFGLGCQNNQLGGGCFNNQFEVDCQNNQLGDSCFNNKFIDMLIFVIFGDGAQNNIFESSVNYVDLTSATHIYQVYNCRIFRNSSGDVKLRYYDENNILQIVDITD